MRQMLFSKVFPKSHPKAGQPTGFPEKIWKYFYSSDYGASKDFHPYIDAYTDLADKCGIKLMEPQDIETKSHTIRAGHHWMQGDWINPKVWTGKPYRTKTLQFAPAIQIKKIWNVEIDFINDQIYVKIQIDNKGAYCKYLSVPFVAANDGLSVEDFKSWFMPYPNRLQASFAGQILCWNPNLKY